MRRNSRLRAAFFSRAARCRALAAWRAAKAIRASAAVVHGQQLLLPGQRLRIVEEIEGLQAGADLGLQVAQALGIDLFAADGVAGGALLHELGEHARLVGGEPFGRHVGEQLLAHGLAPPVGDDLGGEVAAGGGADAEAGLLAPVQDVQVVERVAGDLGVGRGGLGRRPPFADDQLVGEDGDLFAGQQAGEGAGALAGDGEAVGGAAAVIAGQQAAALAGQGGNGPQRAGAQFLDPGVHVSLRW